MLWLLFGIASAQNLLSPGEIQVDPQTLRGVGVQWLISGDDNRDATVTVRWRKVGGSWTVGPDLFRVFPETVNGWAVPEQFAGSVWDLDPGDTYEIELHAIDPDGLDLVERVNLSTAAEPMDPAAPRVVQVSDTSAFASALNDAQAGDIIELIDGTYDGPFGLYDGGTQGNPIVIRGASRDGVILDGGGCGSCNVLEVYTSYVHIERLSFRNANRALRFQGDPATGNVVRDVLIEEVNLGIGSRANQSNFVICDNELNGPLAWPHVYTDDGGAFSSVDGIRIEGSGHTVCHNKLVGWGDAIKIGDDGARGVDFYGNDIYSSYDNGLEFDGGEGNIRAYRNRFVNSYATISYQPVRGGPAYTTRNVVLNVAHEQMKFHAVGDAEETSGVLVWHNTFVRPHYALKLYDSSTSHNFEVKGNLFVGPDNPDGGRTVEWTGDIDAGLFDGNGYWPPDLRFDFNAAGDWNDFTEMQAAGTFEMNGVALDSSTFAAPIPIPVDYTTEWSPEDVSLDAGSPAVDSATPVPGVSSTYLGSGPDLGAQELGCPVPHYGPRPSGTPSSEGQPPCTAGTR